MDDIAQFLEFGDKPDGRPILGSMVPVIRNISQLPAEDRAAMAAYLKSLPPVEGPPAAGAQVRSRVDRHALGWPMCCA